MFDVFWWCSAIARLDARDALDAIAERTHHHLRVGVSPPEEVTTFNFVRQLASHRRRRGGNLAVALHSRALEGRKSGMLPPSGADLEMAIEVRPDNWIDLLLQAKRLFPSGNYDGWKETQAANLRTWAASNGGRTPGMLLYNAEYGPFGPPRSTVTLEACCYKNIRRHGWKWPRWAVPDWRSPATFTLVVLPPASAPLPPTLQGDGLAANVVNKCAMPLECIFCENWLSPSMPSDATYSLPILDAPPEWAVSLSAALADADGNAVVEVAEEEVPAAPFSVVLPYQGEDHWVAENVALFGRP